MTNSNVEEDAPVEWPRSKVFVYGSLKKGYGNNGLLEGKSTKFVGDAITAYADYDMASLGAFPGVLADGECAILGEVYDVDFFTMCRLDRLESNGSMYLRRQIPVYTLEGERIDGVWIYIFLEHGWCTGDDGERSRENVEAYTIGDDDDEKVVVHNWARDTWTSYTSYIEAELVDDDEDDDSRNDTTGVRVWADGEEMSDEEYAEYISDLLDERDGSNG